MSLPESLADDLERLVRLEQHDKRLPSVAAAVVCDGETVWATAVGAADTAANIGLRAVVGLRARERRSLAHVSGPEHGEALRIERDD